MQRILSKRLAYPDERRLLEGGKIMIAIGLPQIHHSTRESYEIHWSACVALEA